MFIVAPMTASSTRLSTGIDSPVIIDSSIAENPSAIVPSTGIRSPGRTTTTSSTCTSSTGTSSSRPSRTTWAVRGARSISLRIASPARPRASSSKYFPRRMRPMITAAVS